MDYLLVSLIVLAACFTQTLTGFGSALVAMPLLLPMLDSPDRPQAAPLMALVSGTLQLILLIRLRRALNLRAVWRLALPAILAIPLGVLIGKVAPQALVLGALGAVIAAYGLYGLVGPPMPVLRDERWAYPTGALAGLLSGAYSTDGPPVVVYGQCRRWGPAEFKGNLQAFFAVSNTLLVISHAVGGNLTAPVLRYYLFGLAGIAAGFLAGTLLEKRVDPGLSRKLVLGLLVVLGARLLAGAALALWRA